MEALIPSFGREHQAASERAAGAPRARDTVESWSGVIGDLYPVALRCARRLVGPSLAEDVAQEVFLRLLTYRAHERMALTAPFVARVTRNTALHLLSEQRRTRAADPDTKSAEPEAEAGPTDLVGSVLAELLRSLPERQREAVVLTEMHGLSDEQAARALRMSRAAVGERRRVALDRLREGINVCVRSGALAGRVASYAGRREADRAAHDRRDRAPAHGPAEERRVARPAREVGRADRPGR